MKILIIVCFLLQSAIAFAFNPNEVAKLLYPSSEDQFFTSKFFEIVETHKTSDPLLEGKGPSVQGYSLDKIKFAFMINETETTVDLAIFNWDLSTFPELKKDEQLSQAYGAPVYMLSNLPKISLGTQGESHRELTNFSYLLGTRTAEYQILKQDPNYKVPDVILNFPHPDYMKRSHPLRKALDIETLTLLSPMKKYFFGDLAPNEMAVVEEEFSSRGFRFLPAILGMMIHEMFHIKENNDHILDKSIPRDIKDLRDDLMKQLKTKKILKQKLVAYYRIVFELGRDMNNQSLLSDLNTILQDLKQNEEAAWNFIWEFEFREGFAEYVSAFSAIKVNINTLSEEIEEQIKDNDNHFAYRTGAIGGLYLANKLKIMPFDQDQDKHMSLWENILQISGAKSTRTIDEVLKDYELSESDEKEMGMVVEYLESTLQSL